MSDIYVVIDSGGPATKVVGAAGRMQGAEILRANYATHCADVAHPIPHRDPGSWINVYREVYDRCIVENTELQYEDL